jgi:hypothetical protein
VRAKVTSGRRIRSKLGPHLDILSLSTVRLVAAGGYQVTDAVRTAKLPASPDHIRGARLVAAMAPVGYRDQELWFLFQRGDATQLNVLAAFGFDPAVATCSQCGSNAIRSFSIRDTAYFCNRCFVAAPESYVTDSVTVLASAS